MNTVNKQRTDWPLAWSILRWSTVICRISAFSSLAEPCFSKAEGTRRRSSVRLVLMRSRRRFSMIPLLFLRDSIWQLSVSPGEHLHTNIHTYSTVKFFSVQYKYVESYYPQQQRFIQTIAQKLCDKPFYI